MIRIISFIALLSLGAACSKDSLPETLPTKLQVITTSNSDCICEPYIDLYKWRGQYIYFMGYKGPACDWMPMLYDNQGESFTLPVGSTYSNFINEAKLIRNEWTCM